MTVCWTDIWMDGQTDARHSYPYVPLCFAGKKKKYPSQQLVCISN